LVKDAEARGFYLALQLQVELLRKTIVPAGTTIPVVRMSTVGKEFLEAPAAKFEEAVAKGRAMSAKAESVQ
jgi:hypothetical protein